jgi:signal peptide peptidase SppA
MNAAQLAALANSVWLMEFKHLAGIINSAQYYLTHGAEKKAATDRQITTSGKIAILPLYGVIEQRASIWMEWFGGTSTDRFGAMFDEALRDPKIKGVVVDIESPGGTVPGVMETADKIYQSRGQKPVVAIANSMAASAAYWLGSAFDQLYVTPGGCCGSVGVYSMHLDFSKAMEAEGVTPTMFAVPEFKAEFNPFMPLSDESKEYEMQEVNRVYDQFVAAVARHRGTTASNVRANYGKGRVVDAQTSVAAGMADKVATLEQVVSRMMAGRIKPGGFQASEWGNDIRIDDESWMLRNATERAKSRLRMEGVLAK